MEELEVKYGLPRDVKFCSRCVVSNQRPNSAVEYSHTNQSKKSTILFDEHGVCDACRVAEAKDKIDWAERERELADLCDRYRRNDGHYDCLVPGSGGKDSFYQSWMLKYKFGMHPLTVTWAPHIYTDWGWKNFQAWLSSGFDNFLVTPNPKVHRLLTRLAVENLFHPFQPFIIGQKAVPIRMAAQLDIQLVFYGENEAEYGNPKADMNSARRSWEYSNSEDKSKVFISGVSVQDLSERYGMVGNDLDMYMPAHPDRVEKVGVQVHYLGYYLRWHPQGAYYFAKENGGFQAAPERTPGTYSKYNSIDDKMDDFHWYTTFCKFGIARATHDAAQEIRNGDITREEGVALARRFDGEFPERFAEELFQYLSIPESEFGEVSRQFEHPMLDREYFERLTNRFRSPHLWRYQDGQWSLRHAVWMHEA